MKQRDRSASIEPVRDVRRPLTDAELLVEVQLSEMVGVGGVKARWTQTNPRESGHHYVTGVSLGEVQIWYFSVEALLWEATGKEFPLDSGELIAHGLRWSAERVPRPAYVAFT